MKRAQRQGPSRPARPPVEPRPAWPLERHTGEGSASALETLQKLERNRRLTGGEPERPRLPPRPEDDPSGSGGSESS